MRYKCKVAYDGAAFCGYQLQPNERTVQLVLERALKKLHKGKVVKVVASGRTDAGVHAIGQVVHFDSDLQIPLHKWKLAMNALLPSDVVITEVEQAEESFHARYDAVGKEYRYFVETSRDRNPFNRMFRYQYTYPYDLEKMKFASQALIGTHDFTSFCSAKTNVVDRVRTLEQVEIIQEGTTLEFRFRGTGFLYNMVRILVGTLLQVGNGKIAADAIPAILEAQNRSAAGKKAPPQGLFLWEVFY